MGAWDTGPFDNDDAADLLIELADMDAADRARRVQTALTLPEGYVEVDAGSLAIAAAALVAACNGMPLDEPAEARDLIRSGTIPSEDRIRAHALTALSRVSTGDSEWYQLWAESESLAEVEGMLANIRRCL